jgi:hypothetical protein
MTPTPKQIHNAAIKWCGAKGRETFIEDEHYFKENWSALPGLRAYVEREVERAQTDFVVHETTGLDFVVHDGKPIRA